MNITCSLILISSALKLKEYYTSNEKKLLNEKYFFHYFILCVFVCFYNHKINLYLAKYTDEDIKIDGVLNETSWSNVCTCY